MFEEILDLSTIFTSFLRKMSKKLDLTLSQSIILYLINHNGSSMSSLSDSIGLDASTMTRNIEKLEKRHLVYRERSFKDTRQIFVFRSAKGNDLLVKLESNMERLLSKKTIKNQTHVQNVLNKINWHMIKIKNKYEI